MHGRGEEEDEEKHSEEEWDEDENEDEEDEEDEEDNTDMTEKVKGIPGEKEKRTNITGKARRPITAKQRTLIKFEIDKKNERDAVAMSKIIARAANLKKETTHYVAKFLFEECLAEYRAANMLG
jgi:aspartate oxidase